MKTLSNKAFNKVIKMMANAPMTVERLSSILDADKDESIDAYFFGRLAKVAVKDKEALQSLLANRVKRSLYNETFVATSFRDVRIISVGKIEISYTYEYSSSDGKTNNTRNTTATYLATDDEIDGIFDFVYKD